MSVCNTPMDIQTPITGLFWYWRKLFKKMWSSGRFWSYKEPPPFNLISSTRLLSLSLHHFFSSLLIYFNKRTVKKAKSWLAFDVLGQVWLPPHKIKMEGRKGRANEREGSYYLFAALFREVELWAPPALSPAFLYSHSWSANPPVQAV